ncbi:Glutamine--scyllo-inositol transaminase [Crinalium epipsammum PCC 9333]|uniref:Glutamine--scyllo-inositol transaminase n=1 Tax=Crinalium epipsammum PCC 9333 TaxID=1173022 RepID=K9VWB2_9CYAN|nr:DegT/DnrJ/EryC1/StrS family aminotransferase [Crinalium epipsammum]AFZ12393.1 Glutamine--scyllo-inositol transaminase [Crinalium epipsammum PCC 9333]
MSNIPPLDLARQYKLIAEDVSVAVEDILASGRYIGGSVVESFEQQFAAYVGVKECVGCNSGTDALYLALRALQIGTGDEVITTPFTFFATSEVISAVGAKPVFVDIDPEMFNLDINQITSAITERTKAIIPVHLFGQPMDMTAVMDLAQSHNLFVIEDVAQATGARWGEQRVGSFGHIGCFSFFPTKNLGGFGDGGACTTSDSAIAASMRMLKEHGSRRRYIHEEIGINSRLDALQAAILQIKLTHLDTWNEQRRKVAENYHRLLKPISGIVTPQEIHGSRSVWNQYTIRIVSQQTDADSLGAKRDAVRNSLEQAGVSSMIYYPLPLHLQPVYQDLGYQVGQLPASEQICHEVLSLPMFPELTLEEQEQVVYALKDCLG